MVQAFSNKDIASQKKLWLFQETFILMDGYLQIHFASVLSMLLVWCWNLSSTTNEKDWLIFPMSLIEKVDVHLSNKEEKSLSILEEHHPLFFQDV